ncbi:unnamed protein product [Dracunculus medinensis]|uniref:glycogenin glucosyltransferase n=1 Tax=Dracunculus medinensis TaxID=318479 RepID=A0A158Q5S6_DRAME|nr:unnamed protein product [Dracunculus medinensis]
MTEAWVTLATTDGYAIGALVLAYSLRESETTRQLHCMVTPNISQPLRDKLNAIFDEVSEVNIFDSGDEVNLRLIGRPDLGVTFTKINCWRLTQYTKCVFLDADCLILKNCDELFDHDEFSAVADIGWPDCFNSGVFVFVPSIETYTKILNFALEHGSFDGGDQGLLNMFFQGWRDKPAAFRLPFIYNMTAGAIYTYAAAFKKFGAEVKIVHFIGAIKPWQHSPDNVHYSEHLTYWWSLYMKNLAADFPPTHVSSSSSTPISFDRTIPFYSTFSYDPHNFTGLLTDMPSNISMNETLLDSSLYISSADDSNEPSNSSDGVSGPRGPCMRVFRCLPPVYQTHSWRPLRYVPIHLAKQMAAFSRGEDARGALEGTNLSSTSTSGSNPAAYLSDEERIRAWEIGHPDYLGVDAFENIQKAIDKALQ